MKANANTFCANNSVTNLDLNIRKQYNSYISNKNVINILIVFIL